MGRLVVAASFRKLDADIDFAEGGCGGGGVARSMFFHLTFSLYLCLNPSGC